MADYSDDENVYAPQQTKKAAAGGRKKANKNTNTASVPLQDVQENINMGDERTIEETYQKKTPLEHVLLRPDTYVGSVEKHTQVLWVYENDKLTQREVQFIPGLYKIFDEILVNAADNKQRDPSMNAVKVNIDPESNTITVWNNGQGVPVEIHKEEKIYVPELIFGNLLTSSNYDDTEQKTTGGRNGYGAKLANIFSTEFVIETADGQRKRRYKQVFTDNMSKKSEPVITKCKADENWTCVTFKPDLTKFRLQYLEPDIVALMNKRVLDIAGCLGKTVKVELNGKKLPVKCFTDYVNLYLDVASSSERENPLPRLYEKISDRWEICVSLSEGQFQQVSFVNNIATIRGGTHVALVTDQIVNYLVDKAKKKAGKANSASIKPFQVKNHLWVFVNSLIVNPAFDSQTKETLNTRASEFGSVCKLPEAFLTKVSKCGIIDMVLSWATFKQSKELKKTDGSKRQRLTGISKLDDANDAGGRSSEHCTLILTEGDSAKSLAVSGLSVVGRDRYGVFPLRGKLLNVRDASHKQIMENAEISNIKQIMGLQQGKQYTDLKSLRYGHLMIMTDQDHDGSHIKGLLINFLHTFWPSLLKIPNFLVEFITPIVKATGPGGRVLSFYTIPEYESWRTSLGDRSKSWSIKYYKGLGTSTPKEAKEYFAALDHHKKDFRWSGEEDGDNIELAFSKKKIEERKQWLRNFEPGTYLDNSKGYLDYTEFVNKELILFSIADNMRSIPSVMDGFKPGQRKIMFSCFKRKLKADIKVAQLAGYVSEHSAYHHGEASLMGTIINLAQDFVASNNINLLVPSGQFGTRLQGGKDAASPRYIYTRLHSLTRLLFKESDDCLLNFLTEDGQSIEPTWYMPILPMVLVNGSEGIGTGWSSNIPTYNPRDIVGNLKRKMRGEEMMKMTPWYRGFKGTIEPAESKEQSFLATGIINQTSSTVLEITELPVKKWTQDYKEFLESMMAVTDKNKEPFIKDMREHHTDQTVHFELHLTEQNMEIAHAEGLVKKFKLTSNINTSNMNLFDAEGTVKKYNSPEQIIEEFFGPRLLYYEKRKAAQLDQLSFEMMKADNRMRFILMVVNGEIIINNRKKADLLTELQAKKFDPIFPKKEKNSPKIAGAISEDSTGDENGEDSDADSAVNAESATVKTEKMGKGYDYLLGMPLWSLTMERLKDLKKERDEKEMELEEMKKTEPQMIWEKDLDAFLVALDEQEITEEGEREAEAGHRKKAKGKQKKNVENYEKNDDDDFEIVEKKTNKSKAAAEPKTKARTKPAKATTKAAPKKGANKNDKIFTLDSDDDGGTSLLDRIKSMKLKNPSPEDKRNEKGMNMDMDDDLGSDEFFNDKKFSLEDEIEIENDSMNMNKEGSNMDIESLISKEKEQKEKEKEKEQKDKEKEKAKKTRVRKPAAAPAKSKTSRKKVMEEEEVDDGDDVEEEKQENIVNDDDVFEIEDDSTEKDKKKNGGGKKKENAKRGEKKDKVQGKKRGKEASEVEKLDDVDASHAIIVSSDDESSSSEMLAAPENIPAAKTDLRSLPGHRNSPEKKVRRMRESPFSKKSASRVNAPAMQQVRDPVVGGGEEDDEEEMTFGRRLPASRRARKPMAFLPSESEEESKSEEYHSLDESEEED